jgi:hypothetical protein
MFRMLVAGLIAAAFPLAASATALVESMNGTVLSGQAPVKQWQRLVGPTPISTGAGSQVVLRFDDGMRVVLAENSLLRIGDFQGGAQNVAELGLLRGGARVVTGQLVQTTPKQFLFRTAQAQLTMDRPADFSVVQINPTYVLAHAGSVLVRNGWGTETAEAGSGTVVVADNNVRPGVVALSSLPSNAAAALQSVNVASASLPAGGAATGAAATAAPAGTSIALPGLLITLGILAAALALEGGNDSEATSATNH